MTRLLRKNSSFGKNIGGRPSLASNFFATLNYKISETAGGIHTLKRMQTQVLELIACKLSLDDIAQRTNGTITKSYLSMIARGLHLGCKPKCRPRVIHACALSIVHLNVIRDRAGSQEIDQAIEDLSEQVGKMWPKVKRVMKLRGMR